MKARITLTVAPTFNRNLPHLGLCSLKATLQAHGHQVRYLDLSALHYHDPLLLPCLPYLSAQRVVPGMTLYTFIGPLLKALLEGDISPALPHPAAARFFNYWVDTCAERLLETNPDLVGFSIYESNLVFSLSIARAIRRKRPDLTIVFGGPYLLSPAICRLLSFASDVVDYLVIGEGEETFTQLIAILGGEARDLPPACLRTADAAVLSRWVPAVVAELDPLPFPDYSDLPFSAYHDNLLLDSGFATSAAAAGERMLPILFGRGCPFHCSFCGHSPAVARYRVRTVGRVLEEISELNSLYSCRVFRVCDSLVNMNRAWLEDFCDALIADGSPIYWYGHARAGGLDGDLARKMYEAGCRLVKFGIESGSDRMLRLMRKGATATEQEKGLRAAHDAGLKTRASFIFNFPGEQPEDLEETLGFVERNRGALDGFRPSETVMVPESDLALRPDLYRIRIERFGDLEQGERQTSALAELPVRWHPEEISHEEMATRRQWFTQKMGALSADPHRVFDPPTFSELVFEALDSGHAFGVPPIQRTRWRNEVEPGGDYHRLLSESDICVLELLETTPMCLDEFSRARGSSPAQARAVISYLMSLGLIETHRRPSEHS